MIVYNLFSVHVNTMHLYNLCWLTLEVHKMTWLAQVKVIYEDFQRKVNQVVFNHRHQIF